MKINMTIAPENIPGKLSEFTAKMNLGKGGTVQFIRTDKKRDIWSLKVRRNEKFLKFSDWNQSEELKIRGIDIHKIAIELSKISKCNVERQKQNQKEEHVVHYMIIANEIKGEEKETGEKVA